MLYGHVVLAGEIVIGTAFTAIVTGLLFVRFSRPKPKLIFADDAVVTVRDRQPATLVSGCSCCWRKAAAQPPCAPHARTVPDAVTFAAACDAMDGGT
jgi:hypothetical protein